MRRKRKRQSTQPPVPRPLPKRPRLKLPDRAQSILGTLARAVLAVYFALIAYPVTYFPIQPGGDPSWAFALNYFHDTELIFGRDVAFTYGPLAYLAIPMDIGANLRQAVFFQLALWLLFCGTVTWLAFVRSAPVPRLLLFALCLFAGRGLFAPASYTGRDFYLSFLVILLLACAILATRWYVFYAIALGLASLLVLIKFSSAIAALSAVFSLPIAYLLYDRRKAVRMGVLALVCAPVLSCALYFLYYPSLESMLRYFRSGLEVSAGYSVAMSLPVSSGPLTAAVLIMICYALLTAALYFAGQSSFCLAFAGLGPLFLEFKHSFVREPSHGNIFFLFVPLLFGAVVLATEVTKKNWWYVGTALLLVAGTWYSQKAYVVSWSALRSGAGLSRAQAIADLWHWPAVHASLAAGTKDALRQDQLPADLVARIGNETVAIFPQEASYAAANHLTYRPFPIFETYSAYTEYLDGWNAASLNDNARAPEFMLLEWDALEDRHPWLSSPAMSVAMYRQYDFDSVYGERLLLRKRKAPRSRELRRVGTSELRVGQPLVVPANTHPLIARIFLRPSLAGQLRAFFFQVPEVNIVLCSDAPKCIFARIAPGVLSGQVPVNFVPKDLAGLEALFRDGRGVEPVNTIVISGPGARYFEARARVELYDTPDTNLEFEATAPPSLGVRGSMGVLDSAKIETLNGIGVFGISERETIDVPENQGFLNVRGFSVDSVSGCPGGPVYIELDGKLYAASFGTERKDVGMVFHRGDSCGFEWQFPAWKLGDTAHLLSIKTLSKTLNGYWEGQRIRFRMIHAE